jgi:hypothetical protein
MSEAFRRVPQEFTWRFENYLAKVSPASSYDGFPSPVFTVVDPLGEEKDSKFRLNLRPKGDYSYPNHVGLYLQNEVKENVTVDVCFFMLNALGKKVSESPNINNLVLKPGHTTEARGRSMLCLRSEIENDVKQASAPWVLISFF